MIMIIVVTINIAITIVGCSFLVLKLRSYEVKGRQSLHPTS